MRSLSQWFAKWWGYPFDSTRPKFPPPPDGWMQWAAKDCFRIKLQLERRRTLTRTDALKRNLKGKT